jgi:hypothetical protein
MKHALLLVIALVGLSGCLRSNPKPPPAPSRPVVTAPEPAPERPAPAPKPTAETGWFQPRSAWAGQAIDTSNVEPMEPIYRITVHHSGDADDATGDPKNELRLFERAHKGKGWACIGYHFIIARDGTVYEGRPLKYQGAHATGDNNKGNVGVCLMGNFDNRPVPKAQMASLVATLARLRKQYGIPRSEVEGHSHYKLTDCPGKYLRQFVTQYQRGDD